ncbi:MAG: hypothetical protein M1830_005123, partial [Pleopsidium flavum]
QQQRQQSPHTESVNYIEDSQIYDHDHATEHDERHRPQSRASQHSTNNVVANGQSNINGSGYSGQDASAGAGSHHHRSQQQGNTSKQHTHQQFQFEESGRRAGDGDMW